MFLGLFYPAGVMLAMILIGINLLLSWNLSGRQHKVWLVFLVTVFFSGLDALWLQSLTWLKQSYGPIFLPWLVWVTIRMGFLFLWLLNRNARQRMPEEKEWIWRQWAWLGANGALFIVGIYGFYIEPFMLTENKHIIETNKISRGEQIRIVQISDIHVERLTRREYALIRQVNALNPDVIVVTGDFPNLSFMNDATTWDQVTYIISRLKASYGVYIINGSNEDPTKVKMLAQDSHAIALTNKVQQLDWKGGQVVIIGVNDIRAHHPPVEEFLALSKEVTADQYVILLHHTPDLAETASQQNIDLYLAGHTHGGQIRLPIYGAVFTSSIFGKTYEMGLYPLQNMQLYVNRGVGMEGMDAPRARFLAPPEIAIFDLIGTRE